MSDSDARLAQLESRVSALEARLSPVDGLLAEVTSLRTQFAAISDAQLLDAVRQLQADLGHLKTAKPTPTISGSVRFDSLITPEFPSLFNEFAGSAFELIYRGSRDGFSAKDFHDRCDGRASTVTLIKTPQGFVFGGYTPSRWESGPPLGKFIADETLKSFLFTVKNPHNTNPRRFPIKADKKAKAIFVDPGCGPTFGGGAEIAIASNCDAKAANSTRGFGNAYVNDTGIDGKIFFSGEPAFVVKEIEIFEVIV
jgi:hypothetical protein